MPGWRRRRGDRHDHHRPAIETWYTLRAPPTAPAVSICQEFPGKIGRWFGAVIAGRCERLVARAAKKWSARRGGSARAARHSAVAGRRGDRHLLLSRISPRRMRSGRAGSYAKIPDCFHAPRRSGAEFREFERFTTAMPSLGAALTRYVSGMASRLGTKASLRSARGCARMARRGHGRLSRRPCAHVAIGQAAGVPWGRLERGASGRRSG